MMRTQILLTPEQHRLLKRAAEREGISMAEAIRRCVADSLSRTATNARSERDRDALSVLGKFGSGRNDIAERHDDYIADAFGS
jgi:hypothetical protein